MTTAKKDMENTKDADAVGIESTALLGLLADIRAAVGDPKGRLMQDELVDHCQKIREDRNRLLQALRTLINRHEEEIEGGEPVSGEEWEIASYALSWLNPKVEHASRPITNSTCG